MPTYHTLLLALTLTLATTIGACGDDPAPEDDGPRFGTECCECLSNTTGTSPPDKCIPVSTNSCLEADEITTSCYCWEQCYDYCKDSYYPFAEAPNDCAEHTKL